MRARSVITEKEHSRNLVASYRVWCTDVGKLSEINSISFAARKVIRNIGGPAGPVRG